MSAWRTDGDGYRLEFDFQPPLLAVRVQGTAVPADVLALTRDYWTRIAQAVHQCGANQLLVLDELPVEVMGDADLLRFFDGVAGLGMQAVQIAYVEGRADQVARIEYVELLALERGYRVRMFGNEPEARLWLRYGGA